MPPSGRTYQVVPGPIGCGALDIVREIAVDCVWAGLLLSVTVAVNWDVPAAVGVPEITPEVAARISPEGRLPPVIDQVYAGVPPLACKGVE